ncbi:MAG: sigma-54 dependent transcriptional regulator [Moraxellaceae bacterium]|nr:sigma-54 dependent transcriptional regulator [Moraxellaceae bacterium]
MNAIICLIEDDLIMGESLVERFELEGYRVRWHTRGQDALAALGRDPYALIVSDIRLPDMSGDALFRRALAGHAYLPPWIFITGFGAIDRAVELLKLGAADYITKPFDLDQLMDKLRLLSQSRPAVAEAEPQLGLSDAMRRIELTLPRIAQAAPTVLITGESGSGKEVVACEIHRLDPARSKAPFVAVNCGGLAESLLEAELFGHEKGAFTGAARLKRGVFEQADGGTLFLDEIGDMPLIMQVKLLRVIQDRTVLRLGSERPVSVDIRLICATHHDLRELVRQGRFREDLYYRIHVVHLKVPPLRERRNDILWLAQQFLDDQERARPAEHTRLSPAAEKALLEYNWPGNVRELKHAIERACVLSPNAWLEPDALFETETGNVATPSRDAPLQTYLEGCERNYIESALTHCQGRIGQTAEHLGISRKNLWEKMKKLGMSDAQRDGGSQQ